MALDPLLMATMFSPGFVGGVSTPSIDSMFKINLRTGTGSAGSVTGLQFQPDTAIIKRRNGSIGWNWFNSGRGTNNYLDSTTQGFYTTDNQSLTAFNSDGISFGTSSRINTSGGTYLDIYAKNTPGFMDCGLKTGLSGSGNATITHNLGIAPGLIILKGNQNSLDWYVYHRSLGNSAYLKLNSSAASASSTNIFSSVTSSSFTFNQSVINSTSTQVSWWAFAHDTSATSKIYCDTLSTNGGGNATVTGLPFRPQWILIKATSGTESWYVLDTTRGWISGAGNALLTDSATNEASNSYGNPTSDGFTWSRTAGVTYVYMAIADS
jgi:hypothetical protein